MEEGAVMETAAAAAAAGAGNKKAAAARSRSRKRGRVVLRRIEDRTSRQLRFSKRRSGLFKKAFELSVLCDAQVALVVLSPGGRLYDFASSGSSIEKIFDRYWDLANTLNDLNIEARDSRTDYNIQKEQSAATSVTELNHIAQWVMEEGNLNEMKRAELRGLEEALTQALTVIKGKTYGEVAWVARRLRKQKPG
ncbi:hypothetical protein ACP4OV_005606 [Aristida adscensionis]